MRAESDARNLEPLLAIRINPSPDTTDEVKGLDGEGLEVEITALAEARSAASAFPTTKKPHKNKTKKIFVRNFTLYTFKPKSTVIVKLF